jgi:hypothetical protein
MSDTAASMLDGDPTVEPGTAKSVPIPGHNAARNPLVAARRMFAERVEQDSKTRLSWGDRAKYRTPLGKPVPVDPRRAVGKLDKRLAYKGPYYGFFVQNGKILLGNGQEVSIAQVPETKELTEVDERTHLPHTVTVHPRDLVRQGLESWQHEAAVLDNLMCPFCFVGNDSPADYAIHLAGKHPKELAEAAKAK